MANRAYAAIWTDDHTEAVMLDRFERLLETVPQSAEQPGFASLIIRAVSPAEAPLVEQDLRGRTVSAREVVDLAREHLNEDSAYEVEASWDLWQRDPASGAWKRKPERLLLICQGEAYDEGAAAESGHFILDLGFEHLFTGHAGLLARNGAPREASGPVEAAFLAAMGEREALREYSEKTRENVRQLLDWMDRILQALPVTRHELRSEGEENFEARLDEILALR